jgi:hypothetical protein
MRSRTCSIVSCTSNCLKEAPRTSGGSTESGVDASSSNGALSSKTMTRPLGGLSPFTGRRPLSGGVGGGVRVWRWSPGSGPEARGAQLIES